MDEIDELSQLEELLCADLNETESQTLVEPKSRISEIDLFQQPSTSSNAVSLIEIEPPKSSIIHNGDTDSSDDEDRRNLERKYDSYGDKVKKLLDNEENLKRDKRLDFETRLRDTNLEIKAGRKPKIKQAPPVHVNLFCAPETKNKLPKDIYTDPVFGIRITKPLISGAALLERMKGREAVHMVRVKRYVENDDLSKDWVIGGVIVRKSSSKKSQKGSQFIIWTLSDLKDDLKTVSVFLFRKAYNELWKTTEGTVVAILNPNVLDKSQNSNDQACLSVDSPDKVMIVGQSKDLGICKSKKKDGQPCTAFVNTNQCEHCIYHVKQEYNKFSKRQELQSSTMGKGLVNLQNKLLGKGSLTYGGKTYTALYTGDAKKIKEKDNNRLMSLSDYYKEEGDKLMINKAPHGASSLKNNNILHSPMTQRATDSDRLNSLSRNSQNMQNSSLAEKVACSPKLGRGVNLNGAGTIDLSISYAQKSAEKIKANAIKLIQKRGGLQKSDPNNTKGTEAGKKRALEKLGLIDSENENKRTKPNEANLKVKSVLSDRFKKILEATSAHQNLITQHEDEEQDKYFNKLEKKEAMEEKMLNTFKLECKAVRCIKCKYTAFSAAQLCKDERHPLKVLDSFKRFFKCGNCGNRTVSLEIIPIHPCRSCGSSKWEKAAMIREKKVTSLADGLSIRGEEETYIGGQITSGKNINLLVPDS